MNQTTITMIYAMLFLTAIAFIYIYHVSNISKFVKMPSPDPLQLLEETLNEHEVSLQKSINLYKQGLIDAETHVTHKTNLTRLIDNYKEAIKLLKNAGNVSFTIEGVSLSQKISKTKKDGTIDISYKK